VLKKWITHGGEGDPSESKRRSVVFDVVRSASLEELRGILAAERWGRPHGLRLTSIWRHFPVSVKGESTIHVAWRAKGI